jgi:hypothetical protein
MWFAFYELYTPKWSNHIFDEWVSVMKRKGIDRNLLLKNVDLQGFAANFF